jgi:hypothetical protein
MSDKEIQIEAALAIGWSYDKELDKWNIPGGIGQVCNVTDLWRLGLWFPDPLNNSDDCVALLSRQLSKGWNTGTNQRRGVGNRSVLVFTMVHWNHPQVSSTSYIKNDDYTKAWRRCVTLACIEAWKDEVKNVQT